MMTSKPTSITVRGEQNLILHYKGSEVENALCCNDSAHSQKCDSTIQREVGNNQILQGVLDDLHSAQSKGCLNCDVADAWNALGLIRIHMQKDIPKALECHQQALKVYIHNMKHTEIALTLNDIGFCHERMGRTADALACYMEALSILKDSTLPDGHTRVLATERAISRLQRV